MLVLQLFLQFLGLLIWLVIIPFLIGLLPARFLPKEYRTPGTVFLAGFIIYLAVFEVVGVIVVLNAVHGGMAILLKWFTPLAVALASLGLGAEIVVPAVRPHIRTKTKILSLEAKFIWLLFFLLLAFQLFISLTHAFFDGDDAYYVVQSLIAKEKGFLYRVEPYTGDSTVLNMRNALAVFPLWITMLAEKTRIHPTIIAHSILPLFLLPLAYLLFFRIGKSLFKNKIESLPVFMVLMALIQIFGNVSIFTSETFLMTRTWQGKSFAVGFIIPAFLWLFLLISEKVSCRAYWLLLAALVLMSGIASSLVVFLVLMMVLIFGFYLALHYRSVPILLKTMAAGIPGAAYILLYLFLK
ncbi:MAG: DUF6077 domain-containing protein [Lachnospiraceae bacterium]|nr:DUF6077 domain-containing protein [Lachnospiraceae bacterium]